MVGLSPPARRTREASCAVAGEVWALCEEAGEWIARLTQLVRVLPGGYALAATDGATIRGWPARNGSRGSLAPMPAAIRPSISAAAVACRPATAAMMSP